MNNNVHFIFLRLFYQVIKQ